MFTEQLARVGKDLEWHDIDWPKLEPAYQLYVHHKGPTVDFPNAHRLFVV